MNLRDLFLRIRALVAPHHVERELDEELAFHIEREMRKQIAAGVNPGDARTQALRRFGPVPLAADECRDARGTRFVDDLVRDVLYAFRTFRRAPLAAVTIVATVALGLGLVTAVFAFYDAVFLHVAGVRSPSELFAVQVERQTGPGADEEMRFTLPDYDALRRDTSVFADAFGMSSMFTRVDGRATRASLVTGNFFQVLGSRAALGRPLMPGDDAPVIVLSHAGWRKLFQRDRAVIGRRTAINSAPYEVVGVMPEGFRGTEEFPPDYWVPLSQAGRLRGERAGREDEIAVEVVGRLKPGISPRAATDALQTWAAGRSVWTRPGRPTRVSLAPPDLLEMTAVNGLMILSPLFFAFGLILMIGCANVANLLLARGVSRQREIGIRLSLGASRRRIIRQLLTESFILALAAAACGLVVAQLFLSAALYVAIARLPPEIAQFVGQLNIPAPSLDWRVLVFLVAGAMVSTMFFALAPALQATRLELVRTMRGEVTREARPGRARQTLIAVQVGASALLVICAASLLRGVFAAATREPGVRTSDTLRVSIETESRRAVMLQALADDPVVASVAASSFSTRGVIETSVPAGAAAGAVPETPSRMGVGLLHVSSEYFDVLGLEVVSGRGFSQAERTAETGVVVLSEGIARQLWSNGEAVGHVVRLEASPSARDRVPGARPLASGEARGPTEVDATVVGVVRDPGLASWSYLETFQGVYLPSGLETPGPWLLLRVRGNPDQVRLALLERLASIDPAVNNIITLRTLTDQSYVLQIGFWLTVVAGGLALVLTVSGLYSVLSYVVEQQAKDIGVRIALGAATKHVVGFVLSQSLGPVGIGLAAGGSLAAALAIVLAAVDSGIGSLVDVFDPVAYAASLLVIVTLCVVAVSVPALRAARIDPIAMLRKD